MLGRPAPPTSPSPPSPPTPPAPPTPPSPAPSSLGTSLLIIGTSKDRLICHFKRKRTLALA